LAVEESVHVVVQVQCIKHFLQLPIEDEFLAQLQPAQPPGVAMPGAGGTALDPSEQPIPFADVGNPIMAQVRRYAFSSVSRLGYVPHGNPP
jgi:hypothetical protein